jgi:hypothetical protein
MGNGDIAPASLTSTLDAGEWSASRPDCFAPGETALIIHWIADWVGPSIDLDAMEMNKAYTDRYRTRAVPHPVAIPTELSRLLFFFN